MYEEVLVSPCSKGSKLMCPDQSRTFPTAESPELYFICISIYLHPYSRHHWNTASQSVINCNARGSPKLCPLLQNPQSLQSLLDIHLGMQESPALFLLFDKEAVQCYVDPHTHPQQGKRNLYYTKITQCGKPLALVLKQTCSALPPPVDSYKEDVFKE